MEPSRLRAFAQSMPGVTERTILDRIVLKVAGKSFATENWPQLEWAVVKLSPDDQARFCLGARGIHPEPGPRGPDGVTLMNLRRLDDDLLADILAAAWRLAYQSARASRPDAVKAVRGGETAGARAATPSTGE